MWWHGGAGLIERSERENLSAVATHDVFGKCVLLGSPCLQGNLLKEIGGRCGPPQKSGKNGSDQNTRYYRPSAVPVVRHAPLQHDTCCSPNCRNNQKEIAKTTHGHRDRIPPNWGVWIIGVELEYPACRQNAYHDDQALEQR